MRARQLYSFSMALSHWLIVRQAREALRNARPDEAQRLLGPLVADGHRKAWRMQREVAVAYAGAGEKALRADKPEDAWKVLLAAEAMNSGESRVSELRVALTRLGWAECRAAMEAGNPLHVVRTIAKLRERNTNLPELDAIEVAAQDWVLATEMADRGDFLLAQSTLDTVRNRKATFPTTGLESFANALSERHEQFRTAIAHLSEAADNTNWAEAAKWAGVAIAVAPNHREARTIQLRAWESLRPETLHHVGNGTASSRIPLAAVAGAAAAFAFAPTKVMSPAEPVASAGTNLPKRFLLWIDGVGGYLVCLSNRVTFGQATADGPIDVPLYADVSRMHAELTRDGEGYFVESTKGVQVNGTQANRVVLNCGDRFTLGATCQFHFRKPVAISSTARLELVSGHRLPLAVDGVLLMAENIILGGGSQVHIAIRGQETNVILYRSKDGIGIRFNGSFLVDNSPCRERANLSLPASVTAGDLSFTIEPVGTRL